MTKRAKLIWSAIISVGMLIISYWVTNLHFPISGEKEVIGIFEALRNLGRESDNNADSMVVLIDVDYDKQLVTKTNKFGKPLGDAYPVTDRIKLIKLLNILKEKKDYAYILLDIAFENGEKTDADSMLFATIVNMDRIIIPFVSLEALPDTSLYKKAGLAFYQVTPIESDFVKYPYLSYVNDSTLPSMPLKMYEEKTNRQISKCGFIYTEGWQLARRSIVLNLDYLPNNAEWRRLGDILYRNEIDLMQTANKYIVIGSSMNDMHSTYCGRVPGAIINFNAYQALMNHHHIVSPTIMVLLFVSFFIFSYLILSQKTLSEAIPAESAYHTKWVKGIRRFLVLMCSWIGFSTYLSILCILTYVFLHEVYDIFITSSIFYIFNIIVKFKLYLSHGK